MKPFSRHMVCVRHRDQGNRRSTHVSFHMELPAVLVGTCGVAFSAYSLLHAMLHQRSRSSRLSATITSEQIVAAQIRISARGAGKTRHATPLRMSRGAAP